MKVLEVFLRYRKESPLPWAVWEESTQSPSWSGTRLGRAWGATASSAEWGAKEEGVNENLWIEGTATGYRKKYCLHPHLLLSFWVVEPYFQFKELNFKRNEVHYLTLLEMLTSHIRAAGFYPSFSLISSFPCTYTTGGNKFSGTCPQLLTSVRHLGSEPENRKFFSFCLL